MSSKLPETFRKLEAIKKTSNFAEAVQVTEVPLHKPGPDELLVKNRFVGINASDVNYTSGRYDPDIIGSSFNPDVKLPFDVGYEGLGEVVAVGENCPLKVGQVICYMVMGSYTEYKIIKPDKAIPLPSLNKDYISLMVSGTTAALSLDKIGEIKEGETVLVTAAAGATGMFAVQWAKQAGCHVIGTCSTEEKVQLLKSIGCDRPVNYKTENLNDVLQNEYPNGVDVVYESVGGEMFTTSFKNARYVLAVYHDLEPTEVIGTRSPQLISSKPCPGRKFQTESLARFGRLIIIGMIASYKSDSEKLAPVGDVSVLQDIPRLLLRRSACMRGFFLWDYYSEIASYVLKLVEMYRAGKLQCFTDQGESFAGVPLRGLDSIVKGVQYLHSGRSRGKVVVEL